MHKHWVQLEFNIQDAKWNFDILLFCCYFTINVIKPLNCVFCLTISYFYVSTGLSLIYLAVFWHLCSTELIRVLPFTLALASTLNVGFISYYPQWGEIQSLGYNEGLIKPLFLLVGSSRLYAFLSILLSPNLFPLIGLASWLCFS